MILSLFMLAGLQSQFDAEDAKFNLNLATAAREELQLIDRLKNLRIVAEKLPDAWKASVKAGAEASKALTKQALLQEIHEMELSAAERWALIVENTANLDVPSAKLDSHGLAMRKRLAEVSDLHLNLNQRLDAVNLSLKDGILLNMASRLSERRRAD